MKKLIKGIVEFRQRELAAYREKFSKLAYGQSPDTLFIACCDSRVVPNTFASTNPGDLFVLRNIGNLIPPYIANDHHRHEVDASVAATIELALLGLNVSDIIICGHSECAAMQTFIEKDPAASFPFVNTWLQHAVPSYQRYIEHTHQHPNLTPVNSLSQINVIQQIEHLKTYPWVQERKAQNKIRLHGWWFDLATADVHYYDKKTQDFILIDDAEAENIFATL